MAQFRPILSHIAVQLLHHKYHQTHHIILLQLAEIQLLIIDPDIDIDEVEYQGTESYAHIRFRGLDETLEDTFGVVRHILGQQGVRMPGNQVDQVLDGYNEVLNVGALTGP